MPCMRAVQEDFSEFYKTINEDDEVRLPREYPDRATSRGSDFDEMDNVNSLGALKPTPIGSAAVFLDLVVSCPNTARMLAPSVGLNLAMMKEKRNSAAS